MPRCSAASSYLCLKVLSLSVAAALLCWERRSKPAARAEVSEQRERLEAQEESSRLPPEGHPEGRPDLTCPPGQHYAAEETAKGL